MAEMSLSEVVKLAAEIGATAAMEQAEKRERQQQKKRHDWRLRNTKLLLKNYRMFVEHSAETKLSISQAVEAMNDLYSDELVLESVVRTKQRTLAMVQFIQQALESYRIMCERSGQEEDIRRYHVIHALYIADEILSVDDIAKCHFIDARTVYRDINEACNSLSVLIFGVDGIRLE